MSRYTVISADCHAGPSFAEGGYLDWVDPAYREQMYDRAGHGSTFPQIFIGATHVGGCDELYALDRAGKLDAMLAGEKASS